MSALSFKMLFRKGGTAPSILAIALLVTILASMNSITNHINSQAEMLGRFVNVGETYLILNRNSTATTDSQIDVELTSLLNNLTIIKYVLPQRVLTATLTTSSQNHTITLRGIEDVTSFFKLRKAYINGTAAKNEKEANIGEILATALYINVGDEVTLTVGNNLLKVKVVGIVRTQTQSDAELIVPIEAANRLAGNNGKISFIEFALKENVNGEEAISHIAQLLPKDAKIVRTQQLKEFMQEMNAQTLNFLNIWSLAVYAVVVVASYVIAARLTAESSYELAMLKALGAKKGLIFILVLAYTATTALTGATLGVALGIAGTQTASTILRWVRPSVEITPFLKVEQALQTLLLTLFSSILGCVYPALKTARTRYMEQPL